jgi:hypothetical protein
MDKQKPSLETPRPKKKCKDENSTLPRREVGGYADQGLKEPTRYGDWEVKGRCTDF